MRFTKSALTMAILLASSGAMAVSGTVGTNVDGYDFSGHTARSQALQLDYFAGHQDSGDIFVNPALVGKYGSRVAINVDNGNNGASGDGGVFFSNGTSTYGVYIGRDSAANFGKNIDDIYREINILGISSAGITETEPQSQFDLFYGFDTDAFAIGARLNYQANEQKDKIDPRVTGISGFESIDAFLQNRSDNAFANNATTPGYTGPTPLATIITPSTAAEGWKYNADEINLSVGFVLKELNIDGALLIGKASGAFKNYETVNDQRTQLFDDAGEQGQRIFETRSTAEHINFELDYGLTLGLSLRGQVFKKEDSKLTMSFSYIKQAYSTKYSCNGISVAKEYSNDAANTLEETETDTLQESGTLKDERNAYQLLGAYEKALDDATTLTVFSGLRYTELKGGYSLAVVLENNSVVDHTNNDAFVNSYDPVGLDESATGKAEFTSIPLVIAVEHSFNDRWVGRASVSRDLYRNYKDSYSEDEFNATLDPDAIPAPGATDQDQSTTGGPVKSAYTNSKGGSDQETWINQPTTAMVGVGYTRSNFTIDTVLGKEFFTAGTNNGVFGAASLGYKF